MIQMNDFGSEPAQLREEMVAASRSVFESGWYVLGKQVESFEQEWAGVCGADHCVGVANGLDALEIGMRALGIGPGDEVITTPMTAFATVLAVLRAGATPVLADIDPANAILDPESVIRCLSPRTKAIAVVHLYGQVGPVDTLLDVARDRGIHLIEDCAQSHLAAFDGKPAGTFGAFAAWSFYPTKNLGAMGDAGALTTSSAELAETAAMVRNYGQSVRYYHPMLGMNSRLDELQAALLRVRLPYLEGWTARRREIAAAYHERIESPRVRLLARPAKPERHVHHLFVVTTDEREALQAHLRDRGVSSLIHYPVPVHQQDPCRHLPRDPKGLPNAERHAATCLSLPCHPGLSDEAVHQVIAAVNSF
ncbi:DegT/DnrJ/EryC1/StrS family aminotransferase [Indioceanicola profundi]|uniref:DegT/DnrJ/EryC1/StrS family aminotransferase n=1 Tax=Indioceanicola profundi TaxID=2220096 RepID=UPI000E6AD88E|nr:DegT/DnrJ/EryC1/StrS family aminotransferase [Indioceanicola profundi]